MAENDKDNKDFEFIKEQVIEKKRKKIKKRLLPFLMTIILAIIFGLVAAATFALTEPGLYNILHKEEEVKTPISFPTPSQIPTPTVTVTPVITDGDDDSNVAGVTDIPQPTQAPEDTLMPGEMLAEPTPDLERIYANIDDLAAVSGEIRNVANEVNKSIVNISSTFTVVDWFNKSVEKTVETTGVIIADNKVDFLVLVSLDRVQNAESIRIKFMGLAPDAIYVDAVLQDYNSDVNLALLAVAKEDIPQNYLTNLQAAVQGESYSMAVGDPVIALGNPNGHLNSMDIGIITSKGSSINITDNEMELFNTNIKDNPNSDGIIVNLKGEIIGLITRTLKEDINTELSTAIAYSKIQPYIERMANQTPRVYFGIKAVNLNDITKQEHKVSNGIYVNEVQPDSPAYDAGMKSGDIIQFINDQTIVSTNSFYNNISAYEPGAVIKVKIRRTSGTSDKDMELPVVLAGRNN